MRTRCPCCGAALGLDVLLAHEDARGALKAAFALGAPLGAALVRYLTLHRPAQRELSMERVARLLGELLPDVQAQRIVRGGQVHEAPPAAWVWAIAQAVQARDEGRLKTPLKGHGWLYEVLANWRSQQGHACEVLSAQRLGDGTAAAPGRVASRTMAGIAALEEFKRGAASSA